MKIWLPYVTGNSGSDVFVERLARGLNAAGHEAIADPVGHFWQYCPWRLRYLAEPPDTDIIIANSWNGFAYRRKKTKLVVVVHHCVHDPAFRRYCSVPQLVFHRTAIRYFERSSLLAADAVVAVSSYTARSVQKTFGNFEIETILNGIDTSFFCPDGAKRIAPHDGPMRLLFVGNLSRRKGADLLPEVMRKLGAGFELQYTSGLRTTNIFADVPQMKAVGKLSNEELRNAYQAADLLFFPTRLEGFGYSAAEAMACGTPVVASDCSALPELITNGETGILCPVDDIDAFAGAIRSLAENSKRRAQMGERARAYAEEKLSISRMIEEYIRLFERLTS